MKLKPDLILFDMDGVLINSVDVWLTSLNIALDQFNNKKIKRIDFIENYWGHDLNSTIKKIGANQKVVLFCNILYKKNLNKVKLLPNVILTLQKLNNYKKCVITNTPKDQTDDIIKRFNLSRFFNAILTSDDVRNAKPNPEIIYKACKLFNVEPKNVLLIGDTKSDIKAGKAAGCSIIGLNIKADYTIKNIIELINLLKI